MSVRPRLVGMSVIACLHEMALRNPQAFEAYQIAGLISCYRKDFADLVKERDYFFPHFECLWQAGILYGQGRIWQPLPKGQASSGIRISEDVRLMETASGPEIYRARWLNIDTGRWMRVEKGQLITVPDVVLGIGDDLAKVVLEPDSNVPAGLHVVIQRLDRHTGEVLEEYSSAIRGRREVKPEAPGGTAPGA
ncbi:MAG: hypothetical protein M3O22_06925 [Pseudomonadota bacterium]|nr:hypothetical protein [Pseudomonadota bacterium]